MLIDSHCHLTDKKLSANIKRHLENAMHKGIKKVITVGTNIKDSGEAVRVAEQFEQVYCTTGVYPHEDLDKPPKEIKNSLQKLLESSDKIIGIGECGIDIQEKQPSYKTRDVDEQREFFRLQIELAIENKLPVVIHNRNGDAIILEILADYRKEDLKGVAHCFVSSWEVAEKFLELDFYISFSGIITYPSGKSILDTVKRIPPDRILVETDAPFLTPQAYRRELNEPKYVKIIAEKVAAVRNSPLEAVEKQTYENTCRLFGI